MRNSILGLAITVSLSFLSACDGASDENEEAQWTCATVYDPVCAKAQASINCVTMPCPTHLYSTHSNSCVAQNAHSAAIAFPDECEGLEDQASFADPPIQILELAEDPAAGADTTINLAEISGDIIELEVQYAGGCEDHEFNLYASSSFMESNPVQSEVLLEHITTDTCESLVTETLRFDLLPIREHYQRAYGNNSSGIILGNLGLYDW